MSNTDNKSNSSKSPYSHLIDSSPNDYETKNDPYNKNLQNNNIQSNKTFYTPQNNSYSNTNFRQPHQGQAQSFTQPLNPNQKENNYYSQQEKTDLKSMFIQKVKDDFNLIPTQYRDNIKRINSLFIISTYTFPIYALFYMIKDYPSINELSKKKIFISTGIYIGLLFFINQYSNQQYENSYKFLMNKYSPDELRTIIEEYHSVNTQNSIMAYKSQDPQTENPRI